MLIGLKGRWVRKLEAAGLNYKARVRLAIIAFTPIKIFSALVAFFYSALILNYSFIYFICMMGIYFLYYRRIVQTITESTPQPALAS